MALTITKPVVNGSSGTWGTILNQALDDITTQVNTNLTNITTHTGQITTANTNITNVTGRVTTLENNAAGTQRGTSVLRAYSISAQSISDGGTAALTFTSGVVYDGLGGMGTPSNGRYTCQLAGVYEFAGGFAFAAPGSWSSTAPGYRMCYWTLNGTAIQGGTVQVAGSGYISAVPARTMTISLTGGDYVQLYVQQVSGAALSTQATSGGQYNPYMTAKYLGAS